MKKDTVVVHYMFKAAASVHHNFVIKVSLFKPFTMSSIFKKYHISTSLYSMPALHDLGEFPHLHRLHDGKDSSRRCLYFVL
jgi:hypothetical protein